MNKRYERYRYIIIAWIVFAIGIVLIIAGIATGELPAIWQKAVIICLECIGLG